MVCIRKDRLAYLFKVRDALKILIDLKYREYDFISSYQYVLDEIAYFTPECETVKQEGRY